MDNKITEVIVYKDRACITRTCKLKLTKGKNSVSFNELTPHLLQDSINIKIEGSQNVKFEGTEVKQKVIENIKNEEIKALEDKLKKYNEEISVLEINNARLKNSKDLINKIKLLKSETLFKEFYLGNKTIKDMPLELNFIKNNLININAEESKIAKNKKELLKKIETLQNEINNKIQSRYKNVIDINVFLDSDLTDDILIHLSYIVLNAGWTPVYDARLNTKKEELILNYFGLIKQLTGEDWSEVKIVLSTANPAIGAYIPELQPSYINFMNYDATPSAMASGAGSIVQQAKIEKTSLTVNFVIQKNDSINSDGTEKKILISGNKFPVSFEYKTVPKISENIFITGIFENNLDYPFLEGSVKVFHDGDYIGDSWTKNIVPGELFNLSLGYDDNFKIKRNLLNRFKSKKGITGNSSKFEYHYRIIIDNFKKSPKDIIIIDQLPVSKNKEIKIKLESSTDKIEPDEYGNLHWKKTIEPGKKTEIDYIFDVEYPNGKTIIGLD